MTKITQRPTVILTGRLTRLEPHVAASIRKLAAIARARLDREANPGDYTAEDQAEEDAA